MHSLFSKTLKKHVTVIAKERKVVKANITSQSTAANRTYIELADIDGGWAWVVMVASFGCFILCGGVTYTSGVLHSVLLNRYNAQVSVTAWASGLYTALISMSGKGHGSLLYIQIIYVFASMPK